VKRLNKSERNLIGLNESDKMCGRSSGSWPAGRPPSGYSMKKTERARRPM